MQRERQRIIVLCHGCFDLLHVGHVRHLKAAKTFGGRLVVSLSRDDDVRKLKGAGRPIYRLEERMEVIAALAFVDEVIVSNCASGADAILKVRPNIFCKGVDYSGKGICREERDACADVGAVVRYTDTEKRSVREDMEKCASS